ncbi:MAG: hypothetical protein ACOCR1_02205 [Planctomycetota bacterium]
MAHEDSPVRTRPMARARQKKGNPITNFVRNSPFLFLSLIFHLGVLVLLAFITAREPEPPQKEISIDVEEMETDEMEPEPIQEEQDLDKEATEAAMSGRGSSGEGDEGDSHEEAAGEAEDVDVEKPDVMGMESAASAGGEGDFEGEGDEGFGLARSEGRGEGAEGAVDKFAIASINAIANGRTLIVVMPVRTRSVIYGPLPEMTERMEHYFEEIDDNLPGEIADRGYWQVVSFGEEPSFKGRPSQNLTYIEKQLKDIKMDESGQENVARAVNAVLDKFGDEDFENILIGCMIDEAGSDIQEPVVLDRTIKRMRDNNARFYVFGEESLFAHRKKRVRLKIDMDELQPRDQEIFKGFEGRTVTGWINAGPESPRPELWWGENWNRWKRWGANLHGILSGFGMYELNRLVLATKGSYFSMSSDSDEKYDLDKLYGEYKPDISNKFEYDKKMKQDKLRAELKNIWDKIGSFYRSLDLRSDNQVEKNLRRAKQGREFCIEKAKKLHDMVDDYQSDAYNAKRWVAHAEITRAELLRLRFMLGQYYASLDKARKEHGGNLKRREKRYVMNRGKAPDDYEGPEKAKRERDLAREHLDMVIEKHSDTPWEILAEKMKKNIRPWRAKFADLPEKGTGGRKRLPDVKF